MKSTTIFVTLIVTGLNTAYSQSHSFQTLQNNFSQSENVYAFQASGFLARTMLWLAGQHVTKAFKEVSNVRLISIPKSGFKEIGLSVAGFRKILHEDYYEELEGIRSEGNRINIYLQSRKNPAQNKYPILIDNPEDVVAVEIKGYIDPAILQAKPEKLCYTN
jgi:hypothetical protein